MKRESGDESVVAGDRDQPGEPEEREVAGGKVESMGGPTVETWGGSRPGEGGGHSAMSLVRRVEVSPAYHLVPGGR